MAAPENRKAKIAVGKRDVVLDSSHMAFNEASLSKYMEEEHVWYDYYGQALAELEGQYHQLDVDHDARHALVFQENKENGCSDKLCDAYAKSDSKVIEIRKQIAIVKEGMSLLKNHLRAWDKAHDNAQSRGHMIRKEMDKLNTGIMETRQTQGDMEANIASRKK